mgnify:CR=1 FL=1
MVSRFAGQGEPYCERSMALGVLAMILACGFADGDPIVTGAANSGAADSTVADIATTSAEMTTSAADTTDTDAPMPCACTDRQPGDRCLRVINECSAPIHAGASGDEQPAGALDAVAILEPQGCIAVTVREVVGGRVWGGTGCNDEVCIGDGNAGRGSLVQLMLSAEGTDVYDVSLVDGFNVPLGMVPIATAGGAGEPCRAASCAADLLVVCPEALQRFDDDGAIAWCASPCEGCSDCEGCGLWKSLCPDAITFFGDSGARSCGQRPDYDIVFCP